MKKKLIIFGLLICGTFLLSSIVTAFTTPLFTPVVITFGDSDEVEASSDAFAKVYPNVMRFQYKNIHDLRIANIISRSNSPLIIIGHGSDKGIFLNSNVEITWQFIGNWVNSLPTTKIFFIACNSSNAIKYINKQSFGFSGVVDGITASLYTAANMYSIENNMFAITNLLPSFLSRIESVINGDKILALTDKSESGYQIAAEKQYIWSGYTSCLPFIGCNTIKLTEENIFWLNLDSYFAGGLFALLSLGVGALYKILTDIVNKVPNPSWITTILMYFGNELAELITEGSGITQIGGVAITGGLMSFLVVLILAVCIIELGGEFLYNQGQRIRGDVKLGLGAEYVPVPVFWLKADNGADNYGDNGWTNLPFPIQGAVAVAVFGIPPYGPALSVLALASPWLMAGLFALMPEKQWGGINWIGS